MSLIATAAPLAIITSKDNTMADSQPLAGKTALITGAARGIGRAIAERYAREGANIVIGDLNETGAHEAARALGSHHLGIGMDVTRQESIDDAIAKTVAHHGAIDILVNNAGIFDLAPTVEITRESYRRVFSVNVEGLLFTLQAAARQMIAQGKGARSSISHLRPVDVASLWLRSIVRPRRLLFQSHRARAST